GPPRGPGDRLARFTGAGRERRAGDALLRAERHSGEGGGELMAHAFRNRPDGTLACRLDGGEKAIIAQVAQETADLIRTDLGVDSEHGAIRKAADSEDPLRRLVAEFAGRSAREPSDSAVKRLFPAASSDPDLAEEYRRLGQQELADTKLADLQTVISLIDATGPEHSEVVVDEEEAIVLLRALNDVRIVLADRLGWSATGTSTPSGCCSRSANGSRRPPPPMTS